MRRATLAAAALALSLFGCDGGGAPAGPRSSVEAPAADTAIRRLSHAQWENAVRDLLRLPDVLGVSATFISDPEAGTFDTATGSLSVGSRLVSDYRRAGEDVAMAVPDDPDALSRLGPSWSDADPRIDPRAFVAGLGLRAYRRPLTREEEDRYVELFARGGGDLSLGDAAPVVESVRLVVQAMVQSPGFLYRTELSDEGRGGPLSPWEIASRLSFALWNTIPDDALLAAAGRGELTSPDVVRAHAQRMIEDPRARRTVDAFHRQLLDVASYGGVVRSPTSFPEWSDTLPQSMAHETSAFVEHVVFERDGDLRELLTAPFTFVDAGLAAVYGVRADPPPGALWWRVDLDPSRRAGLLTQIGFLAANSTSTDPDAIHRGAFVARRIVCADLPPPPPNVPSVPGATGTTTTRRERITRHTGPGTCGAACHGTVINPLGFAFEHYDALGRWRELDNGLPIDSHATFSQGDIELEYDGGPELARALAEEPAVHACYARHWLEFAFGRTAAPEDEPLLARLAAGSMVGRYSVRDLLVELVVSDAFLARAPRED